MCRECPGSWSQARIQNPVEISAQSVRIDRRERPAAGDEIGRSQSGTSDRPEFRDGNAIARDDDGLAARHLIEHVAAAIAQVTHAHRGHIPRVSPVRQRGVARALDRPLAPPAGELIMENTPLFVPNRGVFFMINS